MKSAFRLIQHALNQRWCQISATRYYMTTWVVEVENDLGYGHMTDWGFTDYKMRYLQKKYPIEGPLDPQGCLRSTAPRGTLLYNRVDLARGLAADLIYLNAFGRSVTRIRADLVKLHTVSMSAVLPALIANGYDQITFNHEGMRKSLRREVENRYMRRHEEKRDTTRRLNNWAHRINTRWDLERAMAWLEAQ